jgi:predicted permease
VVLQDLRFALRQLRKHWPLTVGAAFSLGLGIGGASTVFSLVRAVLLDPLPAADTRGVYFVYRTFAQTGAVAGGLVTPGLQPVSFPDYEDFRDQARSFESLAAESFRAFNLSAGHGPEAVFGGLVTANYFETLRLRPFVGRFFLPEEDRTRGSHPVVVLGHALWRRRFGADTAIVGREIQLNGLAFTVVGVAPPGFQGTTPFAAPQLFVPTAMARALANDPGILGQLLDHRGVRFFNVFGRLQDGVGPGPAAAELRAIAERLAEAHPQWDRNRSTQIVPLAEATIAPALRGPAHRGSGLLLGAVGLLLAIACANVANLLLARGLAREGEMATRLALGAPARRIVRQLLTESVLLWSLGGAFGVLLAFWARQAVPSLLPPFLPPGAVEASVDGGVLLFAAGLTLATGALFGLAPALKAARTDLMAALRARGEGGGRGRGLRRLLVGAQVAFASVALVAAGAFVASLRNARRIDPGYETRGLAFVTLDLGARGLDPERGRAFQRELVERLASRPEVKHAALASQAPLAFAGSRRIVIPGAEDLTGPDGTYITTNEVTPGYFALMGLEARRGRIFQESDDERSRPVAVVNETMARRFWRGQDPVGRAIRWPARPDPIEVVGMVGDIKYATLGEEPAPYIYLPLDQDYATAVTLHVRTSGAPSLAALLAEIRALDPELAAINPRSMEEAVDQALWGARTAATLLSGFGLLALLLAATGVYAVMSQLLGQRRREIGLRVALGAAPGRILALALRQGASLVLAGLVLGSILGLLGLRLVAGLLYGAGSATAPLALGGPALLAGAALLACLLPARAAARMDPLATLREP